jgi:aspartyl-tRNA(Asn)/glutamyl-tRNA(Gln) amidotransferase subunit A
MTDYADLTLAEAATQLRQKALSPVEYLQALLARIETYDAHYNAFLRQTPDIALRQARQAEAEIMAGTWRGPLHGSALHVCAVKTLRWNGRMVQDQ